MTAPSGTPVPSVPTLRSRVLAGLVGGASALAVTVSLAIVQAGGAATETETRAGVRAGADATPRVTASPTAPSTSAATAGDVDPGGVQANRKPVTSAVPASALAAGGIPATALAAYRHAASAQAGAPCHLPWALLAGIGRVESNHGRFAGAVLHTDGVSTPAIIGIPLDGHGTEVVRDTDHGRLDGDAVYDRAVGPMQFIPSTWATWGRDANGDGKRDPFNLFDAAAASAAYLCAAGGDLATAAGQRTAVLTYNHSTDYLTEVLGLEKIYARQFGVSIPTLSAIPRPSTSVSVPSPTAAEATTPAASTATTRTPAPGSSGPATGSNTRPAGSTPPSSGGGTSTSPPACSTGTSTAPSSPGPSTSATPSPSSPSSSPSPSPSGTVSGSPSGSSSGSATPTCSSAH